VKALHVIASINRNVGGPAVTIPSLAAGLAAQGVETTIATLDYAALGPMGSTGGAQLVSLPAGSLTRSLRGWSPAFERRIV